MVKTPKYPLANMYEEFDEEVAKIRYGASESDNELLDLLIYRSSKNDTFSGLEGIIQKGEKQDA
jgi:hypothetical protein